MIRRKQIGDTRKYFASIYYGYIKENKRKKKLSNTKKN